MMKNRGEKAAGKKRMKRTGLQKILIIGILGFFSVPFLVQAEVTETGPTYGTYPITSMPTLDGAGAKGTDPSFGTSIMRLTDGADGNVGCGIDYSYTPVFNKDSTRLLVICKYGGTNKGVFYEFDPETFTASNPFIGQNFGFYLGNNTLWSGLDPDTIFYRNGEGGGGWYGTELYALNVATRTKTLVKNFVPILPANYGLNQMSRSMDDDKWAFTLVDTAGSYTGYIVWDRSSDTLILDKRNSGTNIVDEVQIDKSGRYLTVANGNGNSQIWDLEATGGPTMTQLTWGTDGFYHYDSGHGKLLSGCYDSPPTLCYRPLATPHDMPKILEVQSYSQLQAHFSMLADNEGWGLVTGEQNTTSGATNCSATITRPFQCELFQVATDGSKTVRRLVHHNSTTIEYDHSAFGNINRDGRFLAWTSDWGNASGRYDVYLAQITPAPVVIPDTEAPSTPTNLTASVDGAAARLAWNASTDNKGVTSYSIFRNGTEIASSTTLSYRDATTVRGMSYIYTVKATDAAGNISAASNPAPIVIPVLLTLSTPTATNITRTGALISWTTNLPTTGVVKYGTSSTNLNLSKPDTTLGTSNNVTLSSLQANKKYYYTVTVTDQSGQNKTSTVRNFTTKR